MKASPAHTISKQQRYYETRSLFNRNKMYYDANGVAKIESLFEVKRRVPHSNSVMSNNKFDNSFLNSTAILTERLDKEISRFKGRMSLSRSRELFEGDTDPTTVVDSPTKSATMRNSCHHVCKQAIVLPKQQIKGVPMNRMLDRPSIVKLDPGPQDERLLNNFKIQKPQLSHTMDFARRKARSTDVANKNIQDLIYDTSKQYQQNYFPSNTFKCTFDFKNQESTKGRVFRSTVHPSQLPSNDLDDQKVAAAFNYASCFKAKSIEPFYFNSGKQLPPQLLMRTMKDNQNYFKRREDQQSVQRVRQPSPSASPAYHKNADHAYIRPRVDFSIQQLKDSALQTRKEQYKKQKEPELNENLVCMQYFFKRHK